MELRDLELLTALARHRHFARAAQECSISQPAFSARIHNLEMRLGAPVVARGNRFQGFTPEGEIALKWARRILADADALTQDVAAARGVLSGRAAIGAVPTALPYAARLATALRAAHPSAQPRVLMLSSGEIQRGLEAYDLDAGVTYLSDETPKNLRVHHAYEESYVLLAPAAMALEGDTITWRAAAEAPLALLTPDMQNRRIIDAAFTEAGAKPTPALETNSFTVVLEAVAAGAAAGVLPRLIAERLPEDGAARRLRLISPEARQNVGLAFARRDPPPPLEGALSGLLKTLNAEKALS